MDIKQIGIFMMVVGALAIGLNFIGMVPKVLIWIYMWGEGVAWGIKIGFITLGAILYVISEILSKNKKS